MPEMTSPTPAGGGALARPFASFQMRADVRLFQTSHQLPCQQDPDLFFDSRRMRKAAKRCTDCPFRGRCGYNAVAMGATHGIWGGVILPGDYPQQLRPVYARLIAQFEERRRIEVGDLPVAALPDGDVENVDATRGISCPPSTEVMPVRRLPHGCGVADAPPAPLPRRWPRGCSRTA
jgi:WhiB family redox-sensing transcriptional regulator